MKYSLSLLALNGLCFLLCINTSNAQPISKSDLASVKKMIEEKNQQYFAAIEKNDVKSFQAQFLEDSWIMVPNVPIYCGAEAIAEYFNEVLMTQPIARGRLITIDLYGVDANVVAEVGFYQFYNKSNEQFDDGKFIVLWKRIDGQWKRLRQTLASSR